MGEVLDAGRTSEENSLAAPLRFLSTVLVSMTVRCLLYVYQLRVALGVFGVSHFGSRAKHFEPILVRITICPSIIER